MAFVNWRVEKVDGETDVAVSAWPCDTSEEANHLADLKQEEFAGTQFYAQVAFTHLDDLFYGWIEEVKAEAQRSLGHGNSEWLIGDWRDMKPSFDEGMSPAEYVQSQVEHID